RSTVTAGCARQVGDLCPAAIPKRRPPDHRSPSPCLNPASPRRIMAGSSPLSPLSGEAMKLNGATIPDEVVRRVVERRGREHCFDDWSVAFEISTPAMRQKRIAALTKGSLGWQLWPELDVRPEDEIVDKYRYSGFLPGTSELADRLHLRGFDTLLITGTVTN